VFHCAIYKDVGMALNLNRLIVSAPSCIYSVHVVLGRMEKISWTDRVRNEEVFYISNFRRVLNVVCFRLDDSPASVV
jgi:hypothetical protein